MFPSRTSKNASTCQAGGCVFKGDRKRTQNGQIKKNKVFGLFFLPEGVQRYIEWRGLFIA